MTMIPLSFDSVMPVQLSLPSFGETFTDCLLKMSLLTSDHIYLIGKIHLQNGHCEDENQYVVFYHSTIECHQMMTQHQIVQGLFQDHVTDGLSPIPDGLYNFSSQVYFSPLYHV